MSNRSTQQSPGTSAVSQINQLKPIPGIDDVAEDITQRPTNNNNNNNNRHGESTRQTTNSVMKEIDPKSTRQKPLSPAAAAASSTSPTSKDKSQMGSIMGNSVMGNSTMKSVIKPLDLEQHKKQQEGEEPSSDNSVTSSPTPIQPFPDSTTPPTNTSNKNNAKNKSNEAVDPSAEQFQPKRKSPSPQTAREKKSVHQIRTKRSTSPAPITETTPGYASKSAPNSPGAAATSLASTSMSQSQSKGKESTSFFSKFTKNLLPSSSSTQKPPQQQNPAALPKSKSATSIYERKKPKEKK
uniref:Uncharacterized protein n=1 Tax=Panagrolaimus sp. ES5 TaxID=591445 RepID=A0AC34FNC5_9BILA